MQLRQHCTALLQHPEGCTICGRPPLCEGVLPCAAADPKGTGQSLTTPLLLRQAAIKSKIPQILSTHQIAMHGVNAHRCMIIRESIECRKYSPCQRCNLSGAWCTEQKRHTGLTPVPTRVSPVRLYLVSWKQLTRATDLEYSQLACSPHKGLSLPACMRTAWKPVFRTGGGSCMTLILSTSSLLLPSET